VHHRVAAEGAYLARATLVFGTGSFAVICRDSIYKPERGQAE
jgi:hypothetical protein